MPGAISCVEWIPKGVADPNPKRYELSQREQELIDSYQEIEKEGGTVPIPSQHATSNDADGMDVMGVIQEEMDGNDDDAAADATNDDGDGATKEVTTTKSTEKSASEKIAEQLIDPSSLPDELKMDDYSDDEGNGPVIPSTNIDELVIESHLAENNSDDEEADNDDKDDDDDEQMEDDNEQMENSDDDSDDDDEIEPGMGGDREYMPTDIKGMEAMKFVDLDEEEIEDDDSDIDDTNLQPDDALLIVAKAQEDFASLEINVYENKTGNLFVHHDILLPAYPLCLAHGTIGGTGQAGNFVAVGSFNPGIEIWNLDVLDNLEPTCILGGQDTSDADNAWTQQMMSSPSSTKKKKGKKKNKAPNQESGLRPGSHTGAVMSLSWNQTHRQVLASGSADNTVKIWDVTRCDDIKTGGVATTYTHHTDKVEAIAWHPTEGSILASGSYDRTVHLMDARAPDCSANRKKVLLPADCEAVAWDPHNSHLLTSAAEDGSVLCWDVRKFDSGMTYWNFIAHEYGGCSDISYNPNIPGMLATCAVDKTVALWDTQNVSSNPNERPFACGTKDMKVGKLYSVNFYQSLPCLLACGGGGNELALWDLSSEESFKRRFGERIGGTSSGVDVDPASTPVDNENMFDSIIKASNTDSQKQDNEQSKKKKKKGSKSKKAHKRR